MSRRYILFILAFALVVCARTAPAADERKPLMPDFKLEKYTLDNGLEVILHADHTTPIVGVNIWYKVGSKNEKLGRTGFAHLFEHLMFQGSKNHDKEYFAPIEKLGAQINGSTTEDRTNYYETLPSNALELALWLEADRMGFLTEALTQAKLDNQRDVVKNERRESVDNQPYGQSFEKLDEAVYPSDHPYHHSVIGSMADLSAASLDDVSAFFRTYYAPNNASLVIVGDIDIAKTKALVEKYFGPIARGPNVPKLKPRVPMLKESKHIKMTDRVTLPLARLVWPSVPRGHEDEPALDVLSSVLGGLSKENRLYRALIYDRQLAARVGAGHGTKSLAGEFQVYLSARPGESLDELVKIADEELARLKKEGPTEVEVRKVQNELESGLILGLESTTRKADFLNENNVDFGDPHAYKKEMARIFAVTPADVKRVANQYLSSPRVRIDVTPGAPTPRAPEVAVDPKSQAPLLRPPVVAIKDTFDRSKMPVVGSPPRFAPRPVVRRKLSNGLELLIAERHELPILNLTLVLKGGETLVPADRNGLASLAAGLLTEGTATRDSLAIAGALAEIGASLRASGELEDSSVSLTTLTRHQARALEIYADVLLHPSFPEKELKRLKLQRLAAIRARGDSADSVAEVVFPKILYGEDHPYGRPDTGTLKSVEAITRADVAAFHEKVFKPNNASLIVVGDTTPDEISGVLEKALGGWKPGETQSATLPAPPPLPKETTVYFVDKPAAAQSYLVVGTIGVPRKTPDFFPIVLMNSVLGGQFSSRLNLNLREDKGYSYGAESSFDFRLGPGPFEASASVETKVSKESLVEMIKEITDIAGPRPVTDTELAFSKDRIIRGYPGRFETIRGVAGTLAALVLYNLPDDYFTTYPDKIEAVSPAEVNRVAKQYLHPEQLTVLVVGDRSKVAGPIKTLPFAKTIHELDAEGKPLAAAKGKK